VRKAENIDVAVIGQNTSTTAPNRDELFARVRAGEGTFERFFQGREEIVHTQQGPLREYYNQLQALLQQPGLSAREQRELEGRRDQTIRTIFYNSHIRHHFQEHYGETLRAGYNSLGITPPNFANLSRRDALASVASVREHINNLPNPPAASRELLHILNGLWNLDSQVIPETWI
jgi:hypothetical protein